MTVYLLNDTWSPQSMVKCRDLWHASFPYIKLFIELLTFMWQKLKWSVGKVWSSSCMKHSIFYLLCARCQKTLTSWTLLLCLKYTSVHWEILRHCIPLFIKKSTSQSLFIIHDQQVLALPVFKNPPIGNLEYTYLILLVSLTFVLKFYTFQDNCFLNLFCE